VRGLHPEELALVDWRVFKTLESIDRHQNAIGWHEPGHFALHDVELTSTLMVCRPFGPPAVSGTVERFVFTFLATRSARSRAWGVTSLRAVVVP
jgi:hypothetical protein